VIVDRIQNRIPTLHDHDHSDRIAQYGSPIPCIITLINYTSYSFIGIIFDDGEHFKEQRRFVIKHLKDFGFGRQSMESIILDEVVDLVSRLKLTQGIPMSTRHFFNSASLNALWLITTGEKFKQDDPTLCELSETLNRYFPF